MGVGPDRGAGVAIEEVQPLGVQGHPGPVTDPHRAARVEPGGHHGAVGRHDRALPGVPDQLGEVLGLPHPRRVGDDVHDQVRAERLDQLHLADEDTPLLRTAQRRVVEVLGPDAEHDLPVDVGRQRGAPREHHVRHDEGLRADRQGVTPGGPVQRRRQEVHRGRSDEAGHEEVVGVVVEDLGRGDLLQHPELHHGHPVAEGHRLGLVVGDVDGRHVEVALELADLRTHLHPQLGVQVAQRLVHQERLRLTHDGPAHRHPLPLAAGEVARPAAQLLGEAEDPGRLLDPRVQLGLGHLAQLQPEADVVAHVQVRIERIGLEDHRHVTVPGRHPVDHPVADLDLALGDRLEAGDHAQRGGLAASRGADEDQELAVRDLHAEVPHGSGAVGVDLPHVAQLHRGHRLIPIGGGSGRPDPAGPSRAALQGRRRHSRRGRVHRHGPPFGDLASGRAGPCPVEGPVPSDLFGDYPVGARVNRADRPPETFARSARPPRLRAFGAAG